MNVFKFFAIILVLFSAGCSKNDPVINGKPSGIFKGTFTYNVNSSAFNSAKSADNVTVTFSGDDYESSGNSNYIPAGGKGTFSIQGQQLIFTDPNIHPANFDWNLLLNGTYRYKTSKDTLFMEKVINMQVYRYILIKQ